MKIILIILHLILIVVLGFDMYVDNDIRSAFFTGAILVSLAYTIALYE